MTGVVFPSVVTTGFTFLPDSLTTTLPASPAADFFSAAVTVGAPFANGTAASTTALSPLRYVSVFPGEGVERALVQSRIERQFEGNSVEIRNYSDLTVFKAIFNRRSGGEGFGVFKFVLMKPEKRGGPLRLFVSRVVQPMSNGDNRVVDHYRVARHSIEDVRDSAVRKKALLAGFGYLGPCGDLFVSPVGSNTYAAASAEVAWRRKQLEDFFGDNVIIWFVREREDPYYTLFHDFFAWYSALPRKT